MFGAVINPYDFSARSEAACAALLLAECAVTVRPAPLEGEAQATLQAAATDAPAFAELMRAWQWSAPLWQAGVLRPDWQGEAPLGDVQHAARAIADGGGPLAEVVGASPFEDTRAYLQAMCRDVLRGGRDPGVAVPVAAGLEAFAARHALTIFREHAQSLAGKFQAKTARPEAQVTAAIVLGAEAEHILELREDAAEALEALWDAIEARHSDDLQRAGDAIIEAITAWLDSAPDGARGVPVRLTFARTQAGAVKASALSALGVGEQDNVNDGPTALAPRSTRTVTVRPLPWALERR